MQPMPSPKSASDAPAFFFTTPPDLLATLTDHTPGATDRGAYSLLVKFQNARPDDAFELSMYQDLLPEESRFSAFAATRRPSFFIRATVASIPAASHNSNGPSSQLNPSRIA